MNQIEKFILIILLIFWRIGVLQAQNPAQMMVEEGFQEMLEKEDIHNGFLHIQSADGSINWRFVGGKFQDGTKVSEENPFHTASIGKMFTATLIMKLAEEGKLKLEDRISMHLPAEVVEGLHVFEGKDYSQEITIAQLLQHTSGLPDYIMDRPKDGGPNIMTQALEIPNKMWHKREFLTFCRENLQAHFVPGDGYYYTDTEYVLLGLVIEAKFGQELHEVFMREFFEPLKMKNTAMFKRSKPIEACQRMAELYVDEAEISTYTSLSIDWAGGGLVTNTTDLINFHKALFSGEIISEASLDRMQNWHKESEGIYYGFGLRKYEFMELSSFLPPMSIIGHPGSSSSFSFYCPEMQVYIAGTFNQTNYMRETIEFIITTLLTIQFE